MTQSRRIRVAVVYGGRSSEHEVALESAKCVLENLDPERFDVRRDNARRQVAFAAGPHVCIGMHLARLEAHTAIGRLLDRLPGLRLDPANPAAPRGLVFRKPPALHVFWG